MIYEVRTYRLKPRSAPGFMKAFGEAYEFRKTLSPLAAFFYSEIGPLNQVIHIWPYKDLAERDRVRAEAARSGKWPPKAPERPVHMTSEIFQPFPFIGDFPTGKIGPIFEWRSYQIAQGQMAGVMEEGRDRGAPQALPGGHGDAYRARRAQQVRPYLGL